MAQAFIVDAVRTPVGKRGGGLSRVHSADLGAHVLKALMARTGVDPGAVEDVIFGCCDTLGPQAGDIARTCWLAAGLPQHVPGVTIDRQCGSSQQAVHFAAQGVLSGTQDLVVAGGVQNMSMIPIAAALTAAEPFGFADGISQPRMDWEGERVPSTSADLEYGNLVAPGEFLLGYLNEYARHTESPLVDPLIRNSLTAPRMLRSLLPAVSLAALMIAISLFAKSFKEAQSYLTPLILVILFPLVIGMLPGLHLTPVLALVPLFNVCQLIREIFQGDYSAISLAVTLAANTVYAIAFMYFVSTSAALDADGRWSGPLLAVYLVGSALERPARLGGRAGRGGLDRRSGARSLSRWRRAHPRLLAGGSGAWARMRGCGRLRESAVLIHPDARRRSLSRALAGLTCPSSRDRRP